MKTRDKLIEIMGQYTVESMNITAGEFRKTIHEYLELDDWEMEEYTEEEKDAQREHSIKFKWGHNHDFGTFQMEGVLGDRHIDLIETFVDDFGLPMDLTGKRVLDVGAWCGGTSLLLAGMGAKVSVVEEVVKYRDCVRFLASSFGFLIDDLLSNIINETGILVEKKSLYDLEHEDRFDYIIFPGVLYHLSDPLVALRILFNALKDGGELYGETMMISELNNPGYGYLKFAEGEGSNWFVPDANAIIGMAEVAGFDYIDGANENNSRAFFKLRRNEWKPMLRAGLSRRVR